MAIIQNSFQFRQLDHITSFEKENTMNTPQLSTENATAPLITCKTKYYYYSNNWGNINTNGYKRRIKWRLFTWRGIKCCQDINARLRLSGCFFRPFTGHTLAFDSDNDRNRNIHKSLFLRGSGSLATKTCTDLSSINYKICGRYPTIQNIISIANLLLNPPRWWH